ncbi:phage holin family protein [Apilactobacillus ozensis]|uniref:phage holin family protein n=1 Tax=Apilactobacillus ozensis TaxID=866801 RepID=UPI00070524D1|nr:phage holin family protein [Apilactobacillus ozensis]
MKFIIRLIINTILFIAVANFFQNSFYVSNAKVALIAAFVLAIINATIKPIIKFISWPINVLTLGLFSIVVNGFMLEITSFVVGNNFYFSSFGMAMLVSIIISLCNVVVSDV